MPAIADLEPQLCRRTRMALLFLALTVAAGAAYWSFGYLARHFYLQDYLVFYAAGQSDTPYDVARLNAEQSAIIGRQVSDRPFPYPPSFLILLKPFATLAYGPSMMLWVTIGAAAFAAAAALGLRQPAGLLSIPVIRSAVDGQTTLAVGALTIWAIVAMKRRPLLAGALLALAALIKPQAVLLAPLALIAAREWRALASTLCAGVVLGGACLAWQGPEAWMTWLGGVQGFTAYLTPEHWADGATPQSLAHKLGAGGALSVLIQVTGALLGLAVVWRVFPHDDPVVRLAALGVGTLLCSPYAMAYDLAVLAVVGAALLRTPQAHPLVWAAAVMVIAFPSPAGALAVPLLAAGLLLSWGKALAQNQAHMGWPRSPQNTNQRPAA